MKKGFTKDEAPVRCGSKDFLPPPPTGARSPAQPSEHSLHFQRWTTRLDVGQILETLNHGVYKSLADLSGIQFHNC